MKPWGFAYEWWIWKLPSKKSQILRVPFSYIDLAQGRFFSSPPKDKQEWKGMSEDVSLLEAIKG